MMKVVKNGYTDPSSDIKELAKISNSPFCTPGDLNHHDRLGFV